MNIGKHVCSPLVGPISYMQRFGGTFHRTTNCIPPIIQKITQPDWDVTILFCKFKETGTKFFFKISSSLIQNFVKMFSRFGQIKKKLVNVVTYHSCHLSVVDLVILHYIRFCTYFYIILRVHHFLHYFTQNVEK